MLLLLWLEKQLQKKEKELKVLYKQLDEVYKEFRFNEYSFHVDIVEMKRFFENNFDIHSVQKIASRVWTAYRKLLYSDGEEVHFKSFESILSVEGKSNASGITLRNGVLKWNGLKIPIIIDYNNPYEYMAIQDKIKFCRIKRRFIKGRWKYYLQLILEGVPPKKVNKETGENKHPLGNGKVGIDIGTQTLAISSNTDVKLIELADRVQNIENEKRRILRAMDRSRRITNPNNYNDDGTIKKQGNKKVIWVKSNKYKKLQYKLKELYRKQADIRRLQHNQLANYIISLGGEFYVEDMNFKGLQRRSKKTEKNEKGKFKKKKRFGKSLANKAPSMFLEILGNKLKFLGNQLIKINTREAKASQYNHLNIGYNKKKLSQRWNHFKYNDEDIKIQRDLYSAFLIQYVNDDLSSINNRLCNENLINLLNCMI